MRGLQRPGLAITMALAIGLSAIPPSLAQTSARPSSLAQTSAVHSSLAQTIKPQPRSIIERLMQRGRVVNILDDFLLFWEQAKTLPLPRQRWLFRRVVEKNHRDYFERAIYRGADMKRRRAILDEFLVRVPERIDAIRQFNQSIDDPANSPLIDALIDFKIWFRGFKSGGDIYIGPSLYRFDGALRAVGNDQGIPDTLCLGAEVLAGYSPEQIRVTVVHELFHLYHFSILFGEPVVEDFQTAHVPLMIEGMAVAASEQIYPNLPDETYLHFTPDQLATQMLDLRPDAARFLQLMISGAPPEAYQPWFSGHTSDVPVRGGYLLGREVVHRMLSDHTLEELIRMTPAELRIYSEQQLADIAGVRVMFVASSH